MKNFRNIFYFILGMILITACIGKIDENLIHGEWKGAEWLIEGQTGDYDATSASFMFDEKGKYTFDYAGSGESGKYHISNNELFTTPDGGIQMMVKIEKLTVDTLVMQMNRGGTAEKLTLVKK
ncbi:MAG: lipocalin family protein [Saprospiraceae bacterium]|nr:lipocalin family protein [Saprospiraceae bacterium]